MAITLEIRFTGLIAFASDVENKQLYALFPTTGVLSGTNVPQHHAFMGFDSRLLTPAEAEDGSDTHHHQREGAGADRNWEIVPLGRMQLSFAGVQGTGSIVHASGAAPLLEFGSGPLDLTQVGDSPRPSVYAQIKLPAADEILPTAPVRWRAGPRGQKKYYLSHRLFWTLHVPNNEVSFTIRYLGSTDEAKTVTLHAKEGQTIEIEIAYVPDPENEHPIARDEPAHHFKAYHTLFTNSSDPQLPHLDQDPELARKARDVKIAGKVLGADVFTCMTAQVPLE